VRATVTVKPRAGQELLPFRIRQIRALVVGGVARLAPENVAVVDLNGRALMELGADESSSDDVLTRMKAFEEHYAWKIRGVLAYVPGVTVTVSVELEPARGRRAEPPVGQGTESVSNAESNRGDVESRPTVTANSATELDPAESGNLEASPPNSPEAPVLAPRSLAVSVAVPYQAIPSRSLTSDGGGSETNQWTEQIRQRVASVIPKGVNATINVTSYPQPSDLLAARTSVARDSRLPWVFVIMALCVAGPTAAWIWLRRHSTRTRRAIARSGVSTPERSGVQQGRKVVAGESRRELVRVERDLARDGRAPHIIQPRITSFEDLRWLAPGSLQAVLGAVDGRLWAPALRGASRELCDRILMHMPSRAASLLRDEIEFPGPVRLGDVETAQQEVLEIVRRLDHTGDLVLEDREEILHE
jgi:flagellar biosynthesis/type III secretory pathway M-ring protein FliF/YscJ